MPLIALCLQVFPGELTPLIDVESDIHHAIARSEVERRKEYFDRLEHQPLGGVGPSFIKMTKNCLQNKPSQRPTAEQLVRILEEMKSDAEGPNGELATMDAVRQVKVAKHKALISVQKDDKSLVGDEERHLQQLEVSFCTVKLVIHGCCHCYLTSTHVVVARPYLGCMRCMVECTPIDILQLFCWPMIPIIIGIPHPSGISVKSSRDVTCTILLSQLRVFVYLFCTTIPTSPINFIQLFCLCLCLLTVSFLLPLGKHMHCLWATHTP